VTVIPLGRPLLTGSSDLPGSLARRAGTQRMFPSSSFPIWSCSVWGLPCPEHHCAGGALLPHLFTLTLTEVKAVCSLWHFPSNRLDPVLPDVIRHITLWSSDFPPSCCAAPPEAGVHDKTATIQSSISCLYYKPFSASADCTVPGMLVPASLTGFLQPFSSSERQTYSYFLIMPCYDVCQVQRISLYRAVHRAISRWQSDLQ